MYAVRALEQAYENVGFTAIRRPQMIAGIVLGNISPCLGFSALPPIIRDFVSVCDAYH